MHTGYVFVISPEVWLMDRLKVNRWIDGHQFNKDFMINYRYFQSKRKNLLPMDPRYWWSAWQNGSGSRSAGEISWSGSSKKVLVLPDPDSQHWAAGPNSCCNLRVDDLTRVTSFLPLYAGQCGLTANAGPGGAGARLQVLLLHHAYHAALWH
jgi:hypothetical protein